MIQLKEIHSSDTGLYTYIEQLLVSTFPANEYRPLPELKASTDFQEKFHMTILLDDDAAIGLLAYWDFDKFRYIEYFAMDSSVRNKEYGTMALQLLGSQSAKPIVLEIELPDTPDAVRRKEFYERNHFVAWPNDYFQPPLREGEDILPLLVCCYGELDPETDFDIVKRTIHSEVYNFHEE